MSRWRPAWRRAPSRGSSTTLRSRSTSRPRRASECARSRASWATARIRSRGPCGERRRCCSAPSSATSPTRSSQGQSRPSRSRRRRVGTPSCSDMRVRRRTRPWRWRPCSKRASAMRSCCLATSEATGGCSRIFAARRCAWSGCGTAPSGVGARSRRWASTTAPASSLRWRTCLSAVTGASPMSALSRSAT
jgi:hypothetical protein